VGGPVLEVADIFRDHGPAWRKANAGPCEPRPIEGDVGDRELPAQRPSAGMSRAAKTAPTKSSPIIAVAIGIARSARARAARAMAGPARGRAAAPLYYHVVFTLPAAIGDIAFQNKAVIYDLLFKASAETMITIAADPKHLGARIGVTSVLHTWGSALTHHPHVHMIVPGRRHFLGRSELGKPVGQASSCRCACFRGCSAGCFWKSLSPSMPPGACILWRAGKLADRAAFAQYLAPSRKVEWVVYSKRPFGGPEAVLAYLSRYTHRVAISNSRLLACDGDGVAFKYKIIASKASADKNLRLRPTSSSAASSFMSCQPAFTAFAITACSASGVRAQNIARARELLVAAIPREQDKPRNGRR